MLCNVAQVYHWDAHGILPYCCYYCGNSRIDQQGWTKTRVAWHCIFRGSRLSVLCSFAFHCFLYLFHRLRFEFGSVIRQPEYPGCRKFNVQRYPLSATIYETQNCRSGFVFLFKRNESRRF
jgi:hypothetical protein